MDKYKKWELVCRYVSIRKTASSNNVKFTNLKEMFKKSNSFENFLKIMEHFVNGKMFNISLFEPEEKIIKTDLLDFPKNIDEIILFDEYKHFKFINEIESWEAPFLFIRGSKENQNNILFKDKTNAVSIVGSRETPNVYAQWIEERIPKKKIIVSGLANGADLIGHRAAIKKNMDIVIFPGYDISKDPSKKKMDVWNYALEKGLIISSVIPGVKTYVPADLIKRNYEMAKVVYSTYALYFLEKSGTINHLKVIAEDNKKIFTPLNVYNRAKHNIKNKNIKRMMEAK